MEHSSLSDRGMPARHPPLLLWAPSRLVRELRAMCVPELEQQWRAVCSEDAVGDGEALPLPPLAVSTVGSGGGLAAQLAWPEEQQAAVLHRLLAAARRCTLLTASLQPLAVAATVEEAASAAAELLPAGEPAQHPVRTLCLGGSTARAPAERHTKHRLQQLGLGTQPAARKPALWCITQAVGQAGQAGGRAPGQGAGQEEGLAGVQAGERQGERQGDQSFTQLFRSHQQAALIGLELASGSLSSPAAAAATRQLGPTAMQAELAALSASLAAVQPGSVVLDPFCGSGSLLAAALRRGAALAVGSDIDGTHFSQWAAAAAPGGTDAAGDSAPKNGSSRSGGSVTASGSSGAGSGSEGDPSGSAGSGALGLCVLMTADAGSLEQLLPTGVADAIITDLPYGYRTTVVAGDSSVGTHSGAGAGAPCSPAAGTPAEADVGAEAEAKADELAADANVEWQQLLGVLLRLASHVLVPGGHLLTWLPCQADSQQQQERQLAEAGAPISLRLLHFMPETRQSGYPRAVALFQLGQGAAGSSSSGGSGTIASSSSRREAVLAALQAAAAGGVPLHILPSQVPLHQQSARQLEEQMQQDQQAQRWPGSTDNAPVAAAVRQRGVKYKQLRGSVSGDAIDVWRAAWLGDVGAIREYAAAGGSVNALDRKRQTPLQFAAGYGREVAVQALLQLGADTGAAADASGMAALHRAAARNHAGVLRLLLDAGADPWQRSAVGQTPLMYASQFGHEAAVGVLLDRLAVQAVREQQQQDQQQDQQHGGAHLGSMSSLQSHLGLSDTAGLTALHLAAQWGMAGVAELLLTAGADPNQRSACEQQLAPAHLAARWGHPAALQVLQRYGADLGARCGGRGWNPLQEAEEWRRPACVELLLLSGRLQGG